MTTENSTPRPLNQLPAGRTARVDALTGGRNFRARLVAMGLNVGSRVKVIRGSDGSGGPTLIALGPTRLAIGRGMAARILVTPVESP